MYRVIATDEFLKQYRSIPLNIQKRFEKQEAYFRINPLHPSLHTEKLIPKAKQIWSFRVDQSYRVIFRFLEGESIALLGIGTHDRIYKF